jgi:hypothetical protein
VQELTAVRILSISGVEQYGIEVPQWRPDSSTLLRELPSFGKQVRERRKRLRSAHAKEEREMVLTHLVSQPKLGFGDVTSEPLHPEPVQDSVSRPPV